jgi:hypothetical protein
LVVPRLLTTPERKFVENLEFRLAQLIPVDVHPRGAD